MYAEPRPVLSIVIEKGEWLSPTVIFLCLPQEGSDRVRADTIRFLGLFFKFARIGERLSPYVSLACVAMAVTIMLGT